MELTRRNTGTTLTVAFNYGGRAEIVDAVRSMVAEGVKPSEVNGKRGPTGTLYLPAMPDPDLFIRTSGEYRISNFLLWEIAYSELVFMDVLWPDFRREHLREAVREYQQRERRFGRAGELRGPQGRLCPRRRPGKTSSQPLERHPAKRRRSPPSLSGKLFRRQWRGPTCEDSYNHVAIPRPRGRVADLQAR